MLSNLRCVLLHYFSAIPHECRISNSFMSTDNAKKDFLVNLKSEANTKTVLSVFFIYAYGFKEDIITNTNLKVHFMIL